MSQTHSDTSRAELTQEQKAELQRRRILAARRQQAKQQQELQAGQQAAVRLERAGAPRYAPRPNSVKAAPQTAAGGRPQPAQPGSPRPPQQPVRPASPRQAGQVENGTRKPPHQAATAGGSRIGDKLRAARIAKGIRLVEIAAATKLSRTNLIAMEESRYAELPATPFCRGHYRMYAQMVGLDPDAVVTRFENERSHSPDRRPSLTIDFGDNNEEVEAMAGPPSLLIFTSVGMIIFILLAFFAFLCWFFSFNPASFLSQKLRSIDDDNAIYQQHRLNRTSRRSSVLPHLQRAVHRAVKEAAAARGKGAGFR